MANDDVRRKVLDASQNISYHTIHEAINDTIGTNYAGWMRACWPNVMGNGSFRLWFPKLAHYEDGKLMPAAFGCVNTLSPDWDQLVFDNLKDSDDENTEYYNGYDLIFAQEPHSGLYIFRGIFIRDNEHSRPNHSVSNRVATKALLLGNPANEIQLLD